MPQPGGSLNVDDVLFTLFRHKWLILAFFCLGVVGAITVRILRPPYYITEAKLLISFVVDKQPGPAAVDGLVHTPDNGGPSVLNTEVEILWSHDVISNVVRTLGAERILAKRGGGNDPDAAAAVVSGGLEVTQPPRTSILTVFFRNRDPNIVQPVLDAVIENYLMAHVQYHIGADSELARKRSEDLRTRLVANEEEQKRLKTTDEVLNLETAKQNFQKELDKIRSDLYDAEGELAGRRAILGDSQVANAGKMRIPPEVIEEYGNVLSDLTEWKRKDRELAQQGMTPAHPARFTIQGQIEKLSQQRTNLVGRYSALAQFTMLAGNTNTSGTGLAADLAEIKRLTGRVDYFRSQLTNVQVKVVSLLDLEAKLHNLEREHSTLETNYNFIVQNLELEQASHAIGGNLNNITTVEKPTPPARDTKKLKKMLGGVFGACAAAGLGLAFLIDMVLDRSIKRRSDVERHLRLRVLQAIPDTTWTWRSQLPWGSLLRSRRNPSTPNGHGDGNSHAVAVWDPVHQLYQHADGLRERLMTWFEVQNMNLKKPKLVGVTSCNSGCGVTTIANGLAASLSRTGNGNVLLVNMDHSGQEAGTQSFHNGERGNELIEPLDGNGGCEHPLGENFFVTPANGGASDKLVPAQATRLNYLIPKLKASEYDYIIFDMPRVSQTSSTARMAGYMDIVLLVLESEKTAQQAAVGAHTMMKDSRANVAAVLNKCRPRVPALLSPDL
jgi:uncharacterized protein involved in exopolysaccharide biosynthesis/Mrp family chromosome partitioning ATPase